MTTHDYLTQEPQPDPGRHRLGPPPGRRWSRRSIALAAAGVLVLAAAGVTVALLVGGASGITSHGSLEVDDFTGNCLTDAGFSDITAGSQVVVTSSAGNVVGTGTLSYDAQQSQFQSGLQPGLSVCIYPFTVTVPGGLSRYGITVSHRGTVWFSPAQMTKGPGLVISSGGSGL